MTQYVGTKNVTWEAVERNDPPSGDYLFCGTTASGSQVYQHGDDPNEICIMFHLQLIPMTPDVLNSVSKSVRASGANFGLTSSPDTLYTFNVSSGQITTVKEGGHKISDQQSNLPGTPQPSTAQVLNAPAYIIGRDGCKYYPREHWFQSSNINYYSSNPPVSVVDEFLRSEYSTYSKTETARVERRDVGAYSSQERSPVQDSVMGKEVNGGKMLSAREHLRNIFHIEEPARSWHWCHLIAHSLRENSEGQVSNNLVAGTAGVNGAMLALEKAIKTVLLDENGPPFLDYEVEAHVFTGTHIAKSIRAIVGQFGEWTVTTRFEATIAERDVTSQTAEYIDRMMKAFEANKDEKSGSRRRLDPISQDKKKSEKEDRKFRPY